MIDGLATCLQQGDGDWTSATVAERSQWTRRVLEAAARSHNPARHYATLHHDPTQSETFREMAQVYQQCENLAPLHADLTAVESDPASLPPALDRAVNDIGNCMMTITGIQWPAPPPPTRDQPERKNHLPLPTPDLGN